MKHKVLINANTVSTPLEGYVKAHEEARAGGDVLVSILKRRSGRMTHIIVRQGEVTIQRERIVVPF